MIIKGNCVDEETRCVHHNTVLDIIAIKFKCCLTYYPCYDCHAEDVDHLPQVWLQSEFDTKAILCGKCKGEMSIHTYKSANYKCPYCQAAFNPKCSNHDHLYFES